MDAPWLRLAETLDVRVGEPVGSLRVVSGGVEAGHAGRGAALRRRGAGDARAGRRAAAGRPAGCRAALAVQVRYAPQVRVYAARPVAEDAALGFHLVPPKLPFSVGYYSGRHGAWGHARPTGSGAWSAPMGRLALRCSTSRPIQVTQELWQAGRARRPSCSRWTRPRSSILIRWEWAVPMIEAGHYTDLASYVRRPPLVLAGDWTEQACVEGAVRSGEAAAAAFGRTMRLVD